MEVSNKLNRELLRWIQSLDLAYSIKNVKRDFSNGFLVAEIMSRYYDKDVSMHSYDNGIGIKVKKDNWEQLIRLFSRLPDLEPLANRSEIEAMIHCQNGAAVAFITKLYQCLTKRTVQFPPQANANASAAVGTPGASSSIIAVSKAKEEVPPYAKPTGTALIREKMRDPDIAETNDQHQIIEKVRQVHTQHEEMLQLERIFNENERQNNATKPSVVRGSTRPVKELASSSSSSHLTLSNQPIVKEVQIKSMNERNLAQLRATREAKELNLMNQCQAQGGGGGVTLSNVSIDGGRSYSQTNNEFSQKRRPFELLSELVGKRLTSLGLANVIDTRKSNKFEAFMDSLESRSSWTSDQLSCKVLDVLIDEMALLVTSFFDFPRDFWKFCGVVWPHLLRNEVESAMFDQFVTMLKLFGNESVKRDGCAATLLLCDHLMDRIAGAFASHSPKRHHLCEILLAFVPSTVLSHLQIIKRMRETMTFTNDIPLFIHALAILLQMEKELDETLADLYFYYCCVGLETPCDKLRAASLSMLVPLGSFEVNLVVDVLPRLTTFSLRSAWWEVKAQLLIAISYLLHQVTSVQLHQQQHSTKLRDDLGSEEEEDQQPRDYTEQIELALSVVEREFTPTANLQVRRLALSHLAKNLSYFQELVPLYVEVLFSVPSSMIPSMLLVETNWQTPMPETSSDEPRAPNASEPELLPLTGVSGKRYHVARVSDSWDAVAVAKQVFYRHGSRETVVFVELLVVQSCFESLVVASTSTSPKSKSFKRDDQVVPLYDHVKSLVALGLLDAACCDSALRILRLVVDAAASESVLTGFFKHESLLDVVQKLVSRNHQDVRQQQVVRFWSQLVPRHKPTVDASLAALRGLCDANVFKNSLFALSFS